MSYASLAWSSFSSSFPSLDEPELALLSPRSSLPLLAPSPVLSPTATSPRTLSASSPTPAASTAITPAVAVAKTSGKGEGVFARRSFVPGDVITSGAPILRFRSGDVSPGRLRSTLAVLDSFDRDYFMSLCHSQEATSQNDVLMSKFSSNCFSVGLNEQAVFTLISKLNHSCSPNANWRFDDGKDMIIVSANQYIKRDEEITIGYCDLLAPVQYRKTDLRTNFKFDCRCSVCATTPSDELKASDERRIRAAILQRVFKELDLSPGRARELACLALTTLFDEGLFDQMSFFSLAAFDACVMDEDELEAAIAWAQQALTHLIFAGASDGDRAKELKAFLSHPKCYKSPFSDVSCVLA